MNESTKEFFQYTLGKKSHLNLLGKIVFGPFALFLFVSWVLMDFLFTVRK